MDADRSGGFGGLLRRRRMAAGLTQEELAARTGLSIRAIRDLERGITSRPYRNSIERLADALGLTSGGRAEFVEAARPVNEIGAGTREPPPTGPVPRQLPAAATDFTGRSAELATLTELSRPGGVTLVVSAAGGIAGVGKTALAVYWAHQAAGQFPDGQLYVDLRGYDPGQEMLPTDALAGFLRALGVAGQDIPAEQDDRAARYRGLLAGRRMLVLLDNAGSAEQVRPLLPGSATCTVLVTSRDALHGLTASDGAERLGLDLLPAADAEALLTRLIGDRATADPVAVAALAGHCARLPLALRVTAELAATRSADPLASLATELASHQRHLEQTTDTSLATKPASQQQHLEHTTDTSLATKPASHQQHLEHTTDTSLATKPASQQRCLERTADGGPHAASHNPLTAVLAVLSWAYRYLDPETARTFRLAGLHPGPDLDRYAVAALTGRQAGQADQALARLTSAHLMHVTAPGRYGLHDLVRDYACELTAVHDGEDAGRAALTRLFDHYLHTVATAMDALFPALHSRRPRIPAPASPAPAVTDPATAQAWLDAERATLVTVAGHAAARGWPGHATRLAATLIGYLDTGSHFPEAVTVCACACQAAREAGDRDAEAAALSGLALIDLQQGRNPQATDYLGQALALYRETGDRAGQARSLLNLGFIDLQQGRCKLAIEHSLQAVDLSRDTTEWRAMAQGLANLGRAELRLGRYMDAINHNRKAQALFRRNGDLSGVAETLNIIGAANQRQGRYRLAVEQHTQALALYRKTGDRAGQAESLFRLGILDLCRDRYQKAIDHHRQALAIYRDMGKPDAGGYPLTYLGDVHLRQGHHRQAISHYQEALQLFRQSGALAGQTEALNGLGEALLATSRPAGARTQYSAALTLATEIGEQYEQARAHNGLGHVCRLVGNPGRARLHWRAAFALYTGLGTPEAEQVRAQFATLRQGTPGRSGRLA
ncbi:MAG TPA: tetratricopeptide repeat protein [Streptosporangiaceae bacterium]|nr:tetratricopeptide repeat protein [Streptosporangiaceae bacterium]